MAVASDMIGIMSVDCFDRLAALGGAERPLARGERLFARGDPVRRLHLVVAGELRLHRDTAEGTPIVIERVGPGRVLAEASVDAARYHCDASAALDSRVRSVPIARARRALEEPALLRAWSAMLAGELQAMRSRAALLRLRGVAARLDAWLALNESGLPPKGAMRGLADELGVTPEALYRELARRRARKAS